MEIDIARMNIGRVLRISVGMRGGRLEEGMLGLIVGLTSNDAELESGGHTVGGRGWVSAQVGLRRFWAGE